LNVRCQWFGAAQNIKTFCGKENYLLLGSKNAEFDEAVDFGANWLFILSTLQRSKVVNNYASKIFSLSYAYWTVHHLDI